MNIRQQKLIDLISCALLSLDSAQTQHWKGLLLIGYLATASLRKLGRMVIVSALLVAVGSAAEAQQPNAYRIGVIVPGGVWYDIIDGLRLGFRQMGLQEGKDFVLEIQDTKGDLKAAEQAARKFEHEKLNLIYTAATSVTIPAKRATKDIPIVFCAGADPVSLGLVESFAKSGGRLKGVYFPATALAAKRLEILRDIVPKLRRAVTFYDPRNPVPSQSAKLAREEAVMHGIEFVERRVASVEEVRAGIRALRAGEFDAFFTVSDSMVNNEVQLIIETANIKKLPTMFEFQDYVIRGGLASYSVSFHEVGRLSAKYVQRLSAGIKANDLPVEGVDKIELVINLKAAKQIGLTIPPNALARADKVIR
jgi:putative ABC transport system substrate-binding protein